MKNYSKKQPKAYIPRFLNNGQANPDAPKKELSKDQKAFQDAKCSWKNEDGTTNYPALAAFEIERENAKRNSISF